MFSIKFDSKEAVRVLNNVVAYSDGFIKETKAKESTITKKLANGSVDAFYEYLDSLARTNPGMLHHIYEWGEVGNPEARLVELKAILAGNKASIDADLLTSSSVPDGASEPFYDKATVMEDGITVVINEIDAQALFFEIDGQEFFRTGPIVIENPGGEEVRGSFVSAFEEFYNTYFERVYLNAIRFYDHFRNPKGFSSNFPSAVKSGNAGGIGRTTALKWVLTAPGDES